MARYVLECPQCDARFNLRRYVANKRVRCRKCRAVVIIPAVEGLAPAPAARELPPEVRRTLARVFSLPRLAAAAGVLVVVFLGGLYLLIRKSEARAAPEPEPRIDPPLTLEAVEAMRPTMALPLGRGMSWEYALSGGGTEVRRVAHLSRGPEGEPQFDIAVTGSRDPVPQTLRVTRDGVYLLSELRGGLRHTFDPPLRLAPAFTDDRWTYEGDCHREGGGIEQCRIQFTVAPEVVDCGLGRKLCYRVEMKGDRGYRKVDEVFWFAKGVGVVKRRTTDGDRVEEAVLTQFVSR